MKSLIYDFETLGTNPRESVVVSLATLVFDSNILSGRGYSYQELLDNTTLIKFHVADQVHTYGRTVDSETVQWWGQQSKEARAQLDPTPADIKLTDLYDKLTSIAPPDVIERVYTRGNTFDPLFMESILTQIGKTDPYPFWALRDTRSIIEGMTLLNPSIKNGFIVPDLEKEFVPHDAKHDVAMDVMRMQYLIQHVHLIDNRWGNII